MARLTLLQQFSLISAALTLVIALVLAEIVQSMLRDAALQEVRSSAQEAQALLYADVHPAALAGSAGRTALEHLSRTILVTDRVSLLRIWDRRGALLYTSAAGPAPEAAVRGDLRARALRGQAVSAIVDVPGPTPPGAALPAGQALATFAPAGDNSGIAGAIEVDVSLQDMEAQVSANSHSIWLALALGFSLLYLLFHVLVQRASRRLILQNVENQRLLREVDERARDTRMLYNVGQRLNAEDDLRAVLDQVLHAVSEAFGYPHVAILLVDELDAYLHHRAGRGYLADSGRARVAIGQGLVGRAAQERRAIYEAEVRRDPGYRGGAPATRSQVALPLIVANQVLGVLDVQSTEPQAFGGRDLQLLAALADQAAGAVKNALLVQEREEAQLHSLDAMAAAIDARDRYIAGHSRRVSGYALDLAAVLGFSPQDMILLDRAARLHDVGKIGIKDAILSKPTHLTDDERLEMQRHPEIGCDLLRPVGFLAPALPLIRHHHEAWDGSGYPDGLQGAGIPLGARVIAVADALDAMTSSRPYRRGLPLGRACEEIARGSGTQFDPDIALALLRAIETGRLSLRPSLEFSLAPADGARP